MLTEYPKGFAQGENSAESIDPSNVEAKFIISKILFSSFSLYSSTKEKEN